MKLIDLLDSANSIADETLDFSIGINFINDAIAKINLECDANYPMYAATDQNTVTPLPEKWQRALIIPFICARIKQIDASQFEFNEFFSEFYNNLNVFKVKYTIPAEYVDADSQTSFEPDFTGNPNKGDWIGSGSSNDPFTP